MYAAEELTSLTNLAGGAAIEMFDLALAEAVENIEDLNRDPTKEREITLKVKLKPTDNQGMIGIEIECPVKLVGRKKINGILMFERNRHGQLETRELHKQLPLPFNNNNVTSITRETKEPGS